MDYFQDQYTDIGGKGLSKLATTFPSIPDQPLQIVERERQLSRDSITQQNVIEGQNKAIVSKDEDGNTRLLIGYKEGAF